MDMRNDMVNPRWMPRLNEKERFVFRVNPNYYEKITKVLQNKIANPPGEGVVSVNDGPIVYGATTYTILCDAGEEYLYTIYRMERQRKTGYIFHKYRKLSYRRYVMGGTYGFQYDYKANQYYDVFTLTDVAKGNTNDYYIYYDREIDYNIWQTRASTQITMSHNAFP
jgi:hypothetical protein